MRAISATLLARATSRRGKPVVTLDVADRRLRWERLATGASSTRRTAACVSSRGVVRAVLRGGAAQVAVLTQPWLPGSWPGTWVDVATDVDGAEDVAIGAYTPQALSLFYRNAAGAIARVDSADGGTTWSAPTACRAGAAAPLYLAADGRVCALASAGEVRVAITRDDLGAPDWSAEVVCGGLPAGASCAGLAVVRDPASAVRYLLAVAADGGLALTTFDAAALAFGPTEWLALPGSPVAGMSSAWSLPALAATADGVLLSALDRLGPGDTPHWEHPAVFRTGSGLPGAAGSPGTTWPALARVATLDTGQPLGARAALAAWSGAVYAAQETNVCRALPWAEGSPSHNAAGLTVSAYRLHADERGSRLVATLPNLGAAYARPGAAGSPPEALRPGATVTLRRGYLTATGAETVALSPHVVTSIRVVAGPRGSEVEITAEDGLALLGRATLADLWDRSGRTIRESLAALAGAAEVGYADGGEAALARAVARCMLRPGEPIAGLVRDLLALAGAVALCDEAGVLRARVLVPWFPLAAGVGAQGEVLRGVYGRAMPAETEWRVWGEGLAAAAPPGEDAMTLGLSFVRHAVDHRATTEDLAAEIAAWRALLAALGARAERLTVPLRPDLEVWDRVALTVPPYVEAGDVARRVLGIEEEYTPVRGVYESTLALAWGE